LQRDWRFGRRILENIIPASTGAARAVTKGASGSRLHRRTRRLDRFPLFTVSIFDSGAGIQLDPTSFKIIAWYDNEWGFSR
jgi:glyceraldehyde-3-phosphate dehydrogenase/erythrose-4-phosphate dehydrogenase